MSGSTKSSGFTLIELMVVIAITAILLLVGVPSMRDAYVRNAISSDINNFIGTMSFARAEALKRGVRVVVCRSENADTSATPACASGVGDGWGTGWIVFTDVNGNSTLNATGGDLLLRAQGALGSANSIQPVSGNNTKIAYLPNGLANGSDTFNFQSSAPVVSKRVCVSLRGRVRVETEAAAC